MRSSLIRCTACHGRGGSRVRTVTCDRDSAVLEVIDPCRECKGVGKVAILKMSTVQAWELFLGGVTVGQLIMFLIWKWGV